MGKMVEEGREKKKKDGEMREIERERSYEK